jgi:PKHD-type hydroxylase
LNSFYLILEAALTDVECDAFISMYFDGNNANGRYGDGEQNNNFRKSKVCGVPFGTNDNKWIAEKLSDLVIKANAECFGFDLNGFQEFQIAEYKEGGHYELHDDMRISDRPTMRKLSLSVQLSDADDYTGGDFEFADNIGTPQQVHMQKKGTAIIFPSFVTHRVKPVTSGTRYSLVGWYEGSSWR